MTDAATDLQAPPHSPLFQRALGRDWDNIHEAARDFHTITDRAVFAGTATIERGHFVLARAICLAFGFPPVGRDVPLTLTMTRTGDGETWVRMFGTRTLRSCLSPANHPGHIIERFGPVAYELALPVSDGEMSLDVKRGWIWGIPIPAIFLAVSESREYVQNGVFHFDIAAHAPLTGALVVRYRGRLERAA